MNPEFKRNLWLSFSTHRLIAMPALLALTFLATALATDYVGVADSLYSAATTLFVLIVWLWGARNASASINDELRDKTWDQQRMSALDPWTMTWGKLFGSTSFNWYGGLMCLVVMAMSGIAAGKPDLLVTLLTLCTTGILIHAALITLNMHTSQSDVLSSRRSGTSWLTILLVLMLLQSLAVFIPFFSRHDTGFVSWWGLAVYPAVFWLDSAALFAACATLAAWRVMCNALQVRTLPWAWPMFACILSIYFAGFIEGAGLTRLLLVGLFVAGVMTYITLFSEPNSLLRWRKLRLLRSREDWRGWFEHLPLWPTTLALTFLFALLLVLTADSGPMLLERMDALQPPHALAFALMLLRDACILLVFAFSPNSKRAAGAAMLYLIVLDMLLPFLAGVADLDTLRYFFLPIEAGHDPWSSVLVMTIHAGIALGLVNWRLRTAGQQ